MLKRNAGRNGMLLFMVLIISVFLLIASLALWQANQSDAAQIPNIVRRVQAAYLAKGALQLALLKARLVVSPLYHASAFSVGKNPFYNHDTGYAHLTTDGGVPPSMYVTAPGPAFLTGLVTNYDTDPIRTRIKEIPGGPSPPESGRDWNEDAVDDYIVDMPLIFYRLDLGDRHYSYDLDLNDGVGGTRSWTVSGQPTICVSSADDCPMFGSPDPFSGRLRISRIVAMGGKDGKLYREDAIVIVAEAEVTATIAGETETWRTEERTVYKARRRYDFQSASPTPPSSGP